MTVSELIQELRKQDPNAQVMMTIADGLSHQTEHQLMGLAVRKEAMAFAEVNRRDVFDEADYEEPSEFAYEEGTAGNDVLLVSGVRLRGGHPNIWDVVRDDRPR